MKEFLLQFLNMLTQVAKVHKNVIVVSTHGTLQANEWANELHPTPGGFDKIGAQFIAAIRAVFPGRI